MSRKNIRSFFFRLSPEFVLQFMLSFLKHVVRRKTVSNALRFFRRKKTHPQKEIFGLLLPNPIGLAAGIDRNGECYNEFLDLGFGFVEIGTLTPQPQSSTLKPKSYWLPKDQALLNRVGFENKGVNFAINEFRARPARGIVAASIASNHLDSSGIIQDYETAFSLLYDFVDMIILDLCFTEENTQHSTRDITFLSDIIDPLLEFRTCYEQDKPILIRVSADFEREQLTDLLDYCMMSGIDGIVAGNATRSQEGLLTPATTLKKMGPGMITGAPLFPKNLELVKFIHEYTSGRLPIIGTGGIMTPEQAEQMIDAGASLIEVCTGYALEGSSLLKRILKHLDR